jgi:hypothetical protein
MYIEIIEYYFQINSIYCYLFKDKTVKLSHFHTKQAKNFKLDMETETEYTVRMFFKSTV